MERRRERAVIRDVLSGKRRDAARTATLLNAAAAIYVGGAADTLEQGVRIAAESLDVGAARASCALRHASVRA